MELTSKGFILLIRTHDAAQKLCFCCLGSRQSTNFDSLLSLSVYMQLSRLTISLIQIENCSRSRDFLLPLFSSVFFSLSPFSLSLPLIHRSHGIFLASRQNSFVVYEKSFVCKNVLRAILCTTEKGKKRKNYDKKKVSQTVGHKEWSLCRFLRISKAVFWFHHLAFNAGVPHFSHVVHFFTIFAIYLYLRGKSLYAALLFHLPCIHHHQFVLSFFDARLSVFIDIDFSILHYWNRIWAHRNWTDSRFKRFIRK